MNFLWVVAAFSLVTWLLGVLFHLHLTSGVIHLLLALAIAAPLVRMLLGRNAPGRPPA